MYRDVIRHVENYSARPAYHACRLYYSIGKYAHKMIMDQAGHAILYYNPNPEDNWSLNSQFNQLADAIKREKGNIKEINSDIELVREVAKHITLFGRRPVVLSHYKKRLQRLRGIHKRIELVTYYTHSTLNVTKEVVDMLSKSTLVMCMNYKEIGYLKNVGVPESILGLFPLAAGPREIETKARLQSEKRSCDFIFALKYSKNRSYTLRKNYEKAIQVIERLAEYGYRVTIVGPGWNGNLFKRYFSNGESSVVVYEDISREKQLEVFGNAYIFVNMSTFEGGPLPLVDAYCNDCGIASSPTGFLVELLWKHICEAVLLNPYDTVEEITSVCINALEERRKRRPSYAPLPWCFTFEAAAKKIISLEKQCVQE